MPTARETHSPRVTVRSEAVDAGHAHSHPGGTSSHTVACAGLPFISEADQGDCPGPRGRASVCSSEPGRGRLSRGQSEHLLPRPLGVRSRSVAAPLASGWTRCFQPGSSQWPSTSPREHSVNWQFLQRGLGAREEHCGLHLHRSVPPAFIRRAARVFIITSKAANVTFIIPPWSGSMAVLPSRPCPAPVLLLLALRPSSLPGTCPGG